MRKTKNLLHCWWECKVMQSLWKTLWRVLEKLKIELPDDLEILLLGIYLKKTKNLIRKKYMHPYLQQPRFKNNLGIH